ncbi:nucleotidyltransferase domain-containing protein [Robertmurraya massiliosenegalensis]|uniref:nucleotidyltransferase domain-containing protein n=1 Tax=Robertmurraya massiliosenegalensis TaxID=1287657 RepID=UPI0002D8A3D5|nr:nucleotidyltransferase domain-containing protein [Robertmurraya massiliosenegalensis]
MEEWFKSLEKEWKIEILFACEAGSRSWRIDSPVSDQDVRFIYRHQEIRSYLSLSKPVDVISIGVPYDSQGWDIFKALDLTAKSNPSMYEWAYSPIIYVDKNDFSRTMKAIISEHFSSYSLVKHYLSLMTRNLRELSRKEELEEKQQKQLIQVLRAEAMVKSMMEVGIDKGPYILVEKYGGEEYHLLVEAKKQGKLLPAHKLQKMIERVEEELVVLEKTCLHLPRPKPFKKELNTWLWNLLDCR